MNDVEHILVGASGGSGAAAALRGRGRAGRRRRAVHRHRRASARGRAELSSTGRRSDERLSKARASASSRCACSACCCSTIRSSRCSTCRATLFGVPVLYAYIFVAWAALIALMAWSPNPTDARTAREPAACCTAPTIILIVVRLSRAAVRDRLLRRPARRRRPLGHREPLHLQPVARRLRDRLDVLRQRRPRGERRRRLPADLHRPDADDRAVVGRDAQDHAHLASRTASPRSPTSSPRATARARCWAASSPSSR